MNIRLYIIALHLLLISFTSVLSGTEKQKPASDAASSTPTFTEGTAKVLIELRTEPSAGAWNCERKTSEDIKGAWRSANGFVLTLKRTSGENGHPVWNTQLKRSDKKPFRIHNFAYHCSLPLEKVATVFDTRAHTENSLFRQPPQLDTAFTIRPNRGIPFQMTCDHYGNNTIAAGAMDVTGTYRITGRRSGGRYTIAITRREYPGDKWFTGKLFTDALFLSTKTDFWFDAARAYADAVDRNADYTPLPIPDKATLPYYSTWYAFGNHINQNVVLRQAHLAHEIGCGVFLIFIGWGVDGDWFSSDNSWGDYTPAQKRFPDFHKLVAEIQDNLDMAVQVWTAPTWIGAGSESFSRMKEFRSKWPEGGYDRNLDPRSPQAQVHIQERMQYLAKNWNIDGIYVDFADTLFNRNDAPHEKSPLHFGTAYAKFFKSVAKGLLSVKPHPFIEMREPFANLLSKRFSTVFNTTYTEGNWQRSRMIAIAQRPFSKGVATRCDPLTWDPKELNDRDAAGKAISAMMFCGPPGISMDLEKLDKEKRGRLGRWFRFYRKHRKRLTTGTFTPFGGEYHFPEMMISSGGTSYAWISRWETGAIPFPEGTTHAFLFTALPTDVSFIARVHPGRITGLKRGRYRGRWFDSSLECHDGWLELSLGGGKKAVAPETLRTPRENWDFDPRTEGVPSLDVRRGGFLELEYIGNETEK